MHLVSTKRSKALYASKMKMFNGVDETSNKCLVTKKDKDGNIIEQYVKIDNYTVDKAARASRLAKRRSKLRKYKAKKRQQYIKKKTNIINQKVLKQLQKKMLKGKKKNNFR